MVSQYAFLECDTRIIWSSKGRHPKIDATTFKIQCNFLTAYIVLPDHEYIKPFIMADLKHVLQYPHIESNGKLCLPAFTNQIGDLEEQIQYLLDSFFHQYLPKIQYTDCFQDYMKEAQHYWSVFISLYRKKYRLSNVVTPSILLCQKLDLRNSNFLEYESTFIVQSNEIIVDSENALYGNRIVSFFSKGQTIQKLRTLEIRLGNALIPNKIPGDLRMLNKFIKLFVGKKKANDYLQKRNKSCLLILRSETCDYAYLINYSHKTLPRFSNTLMPLECEKIDLDWIYGRYQNNSIDTLQNKHILCFGAGVLASYVLPLLIREGIGEVTLVDYDFFDTANLSRHFLGMDSLGEFKVHELRRKLKNLPSCKINPCVMKAESWLKKNKESLNSFDLIIDLTGSFEVREALTFYRKTYNYQGKLVTGWMEPYVCAGHIAIFTPSIFWSQSLWEDQAAFHDWSDEYLVNEPGCASKFQPYSGIQANAVASLIASKIVSVIKGNINNSAVFSLVQNDGYCAQQTHQATRQSWAKFDNNIESLVLKRDILS